ncbi:Uncharacterised protein [Shigella sonnei]|nr:Uncharacterised protein [Shigella sonnei]
MPIIMFVALLSSACRINSPVPREVVTSGSRFSAGTSSSPLAAAISINAVLPSPEIPQLAFTFSPSGPVTQA